MPPLTTARHTSQKTWFTRSPRASLLFFLGVFFTFAPVMTLLGQMESPSPIALAFWFVVSGVCGVLCVDSSCEGTFSRGQEEVLSFILETFGNRLVFETRRRLIADVVAP